MNGQEPWNRGRHPLLWTPTPGQVETAGPGLEVGWCLALVVALIVFWLFV